MNGLGNERYTTTEECEFYSELADNSNVFIVRTFKQGKINWEKVSLSNSHFIHRMNRHYFGNNYRRKGKSIGCVAFIEKKGHLHSNLLIRVPEVYLTSPTRLIETIGHCHYLSRFADRIKHIKIHDGCINRMVNYSYKEQKYDKYMVTSVDGHIEYKPKWSHDFSYDVFDDKNSVETDKECNLIKQTTQH